MQQANKSKREKIMNDEALTEDQKHYKLKEIKKEGAYNLQGILNDEQKAKMKAIRNGKKKSLETKKHKLTEEEQLF